MHIDDLRIVLNKNKKSEIVICFELSQKSRGIIWKSKKYFFLCSRSSTIEENLPTLNLVIAKVQTDKEELKLL